ncbi:Thiol-disulfide isomerase and thioredoxins [Methanosarcina siciliae T4/M]|uniref:Thioredoxin n=3 Tax=Methanosarcina siciliae TaxID=38027 RepID=A0A0E3LBJ9_9EURY|nr:Thiol-disulfide isomerase and thioredoxins [Methanosarcina siciliae T4/M]AKB33901.1 Thiol-disulfide isomerase and thioredoxins [Methanosarcina siciliae HI350]
MEKIRKKKRKQNKVKNMKIEILGTGCAKCKKTKEAIEKVLAETGKKAEVVKVEDIETILNYGVMVTPAVVVDGEVKIAGKVPDEKEIKKWIE